MGKRKYERVILLEHRAKAGPSKMVMLKLFMYRLCRMVRNAHAAYDST